MSFFKSLFSGNPPKKVVIEGGSEKFEVPSGKTILESALNHGISYPHDCTVGTCGSCRTKLIDGKVEEITPFGYTLSKEELEQGYILACQALPKSDLTLAVEIDANDDITASRQSAQLGATQRLTHDILKIRWTVDQPIKWRAGQYVNVHWNGSEAHRSYSFANAPALRGSNEIITFMRHVPGGLLTDQFFKSNPADLSFEIEGPHGNFWLRDGSGPIICIAGGSGLAPILSLLEDAAHRRVRRDCIVLFGARTSNDLYCQEEFRRIKSAWTAGFDFWEVLSEEENEAYRSGFVTDHVPAALERLGSGAQGYMCGPPPMIDAGIQALTDLGIPLSDIHYDKFTDASTKTGSNQEENNE